MGRKFSSRKKVKMGKNIGFIFYTKILPELTLIRKVLTVFSAQLEGTVRKWLLVGQILREFRGHLDIMTGLVLRPHELAKALRIVS
jgi:hypothetical protein